MERYSDLSPLKPMEAKLIGKAMCIFFQLHNEKTLKELGISSKGSINQPRTIGAFMNWAPGVTGIDIRRRHRHLQEIVNRLVAAGFLTPAGTGMGSPPLSAAYWAMFELSTLEQKGNLWLGRAFGLFLVDAEVRSVLARITGVTPQGDESVGTGVLVDGRHVLTCAHVVTDMAIHGSIEVSGREVPVASIRPHETVDVAVIELAEELTLPLPDLGFRSAETLEEVLIVGYPKTAALSPTIVSQRGEVNGFIDADIHGNQSLLFSAIARPGNSGGPVVTADGKIVGLVSRSLEGEDLTDTMRPLPFFAAVPSEAIFDAIGSLGTACSLQWETYK